MVETKEFKVVKELASKSFDTGKKLWKTQSGMVGLLFWIVALATALNNVWGCLLAFGIGVIFVVKGRKEEKAKEAI